MQWFSLRRGVRQSALLLLMSGLAVAGASTGTALAAQVTWTTQGDFETNESTTGTPTTRLNIDTASMPGSVQMALQDDVATTHAALTCVTSGDKVYSIGVGSTFVAVVDATTDELKVKKIPIGTTAAGLVYNPAYNKVYVGKYNSNEVVVIDAGSDEVIRTLTLGNGAFAAAYNSIDNKVYIANTGDRTVSVLDGATDNEMVTPRLPMTAGATIATYDSNKNRVYLTSKASQYVTVIEGGNNQVKSVEIEAAPISIISGLEVDAPAEGITSANSMLLSWDSNCVRSTEKLELQIRTTLEEDYHGPDGTAASWYQTTACVDDIVIPVTTTVNFDGYAPFTQIQARLSSDRLTTPVLNEVRLAYEALPDLIVSGISTVSTVSTVTPVGTKATFDVTVTVTNQGGGSAAASKVAAYLYNETTGTSYYLKDYQIGILPADGSQTVVIPVTLPDLPVGAYKIKGCADYLLEVAETTDDNNCTLGNIITVQGKDLVISSLSGTVTGGKLNYSMVVKNQGNVTTEWCYVSFYLSDDSTIAAGDKSFDSSPTVYTLGPGAIQSSFPGSLWIPANHRDGYYYIGAWVDNKQTYPNNVPTATQLRAESDETNNTRLSSSTSYHITNELVGVSAQGSVANGLLTYSATFTNLGNGSITYSKYKVELLRNGVVISDLTAGINTPLNDFKGGTERTFGGSVSFTGTPGDVYQIRGSVTPQTPSLYEDDADNNFIDSPPIVLP